MGSAGQREPRRRTCGERPRDQGAATCDGEARCARRGRRRRRTGGAGEPALVERSREPALARIATEQQRREQDEERREVRQPDADAEHCVSDAQNRREQAGSRKRAALEVAWHGDSVTQQGGLSLSLHGAIKGTDPVVACCDHGAWPCVAPDACLRAEVDESILSTCVDLGDSSCRCPAARVVVPDVGRQRVLGWRAARPADLRRHTGRRLALPRRSAPLIQPAISRPGRREAAGPTTSRGVRASCSARPGASGRPCSPGGSFRRR